MGAVHYTWGFDEGRISDAHLYNNCYRLSELFARLIHVRIHLDSSVLMTYFIGQQYIFYYFCSIGIRIRQANIFFK